MKSLSAFILIFCIVSISAISTSFAARNTEWKPKYQSKTLKNQKAFEKNALGSNALETEKTVLKKLKEKIKPVKNTKVSSLAKVKTGKTKIIPDHPLEALYLKTSKSKTFLAKLKSESLKYKQKAVPTLIKVMKSKNYPDENRWIATFMLGRIVGVKSADFISKFTRHPNWMLRLASLKVLLHLEQRQYKGIYANLLEDTSLIVRHQALQNIKELKITSLAPYVWKMLYNKQNYVGQKGARKRSNIIRDAIKLVGDLGLDAAKKPMLKMIGKKKYKDVHTELDYSLSKLHKKPSPKGTMEVKKIYWSRLALKNLTF